MEAEIVRVVSIKNQDTLNPPISFRLQCMYEILIDTLSNFLNDLFIDLLWWSKRGKVETKDVTLFVEMQTSANDENMGSDWIETVFWFWV